MSVNKVIILGNVGQDPEIKLTQTQQQIVQLSVATSENWTDKATNEKKEKTEWHRIVIFGKLADIAAQYVHKGSKVYIEGALKTNKWQDKTGADRYTTEIIVSGFNGVLQMLDSKSGNTADATAVATTVDNAVKPVPNVYKKLSEAQKQAAANPEKVAEPFDDDIPF